MRALLCLILWGLFGCTASRSASRVLEQPHSILRNQPQLVQRFIVAGEPQPGLSGMDVDDVGNVIAVTERDSHFVRIHLQQDRAKVVSTISLPGFAEGQDAEALAWLGADRVAVGTERHVPSRSHDDIFIYQLDSNQAALVDTIQLPYSLWDMRADDNRGIEGACYAAQHLLVGVETTGKVQGKRFAPLAMYDFKRGHWTATRLHLTSSKGLLSSLACRLDAANQKLEVLAIERYYETSRLLTFHVPLSGLSEAISPVVVRDLAAITPHAVPNWEGVAWEHRQGVMILNDNQTANVNGLVEVMRLSQRTVKGSISR